MEYKTVVDPIGIRVKSELNRNLFATGVYQDNEVTVIEHEKKRMLVANTMKDMCMRFDIVDTTPISLNKIS